MSFAIDGESIPVKDFTVSLGTNESLSTVSGESSIALLRETGIDVFGASQSDEGCPIDVYAGYDGSSTHLFSGVLDAADWQFGKDLVSWEGRDHAAPLADTKQVLIKIDFRNQTIGQIVRQIAEEFDLRPRVTDPGTIAGSQMWDEHSYMPHGQQYWSILQDLARQCGYVCFVTPEKELVFEPPEQAGGEQITVTWGALAGTDAENPLLDLDILYQPRRNGNVDVRVVTYHPQRRQYITGQARAQMQNIGTVRSNRRVLIGRNQRGRQTARSSGSRPSARPAVVIRADGLTRDQADARAQALADDLAKKQIVLKGTVEGLPNMQLHSRLRLRQGDMDVMGFDSLDYRISAVTHRFSMPEGGGGQGWITEFTAITPPEGN